MLDIAVSNEQASVGVDEERLRAAVCAVLAGEGVTSATISVAIVDDPTIHRLNREFLGHDSPTDVLSFLLDESQASIEGEIVVSADTAAAVATQFDWDAGDELLLYVIHGALHLVGYDDQSSDQQSEMRHMEQHYLKHMGVSVRHEDQSQAHPVRR